jgi:hypothetical protein
MNYVNLKIKLIRVLAITGAASCVVTVLNARERSSPIADQTMLTRKIKILQASVRDARLII